MNAQDAAEILARGGRVRRVSWPDFLYLDPGDKIPDEDLSALDWLELSEQDWEIIQDEANGIIRPEPMQESIQNMDIPSDNQTLSDTTSIQESIQQPQPTGVKMTQIKVKSKRDLKLSATYAGLPAEVVFIEEAAVSDTSSALILSGDSPKVLGIKENQGLSIKVKAVIKNSKGEAFEVDATSNLFDVIAEDVAMMPALDENGQPVQDVDANGNVVLDDLGNPKIKMIPAGALLTALVPEV